MGVKQFVLPALAFAAQASAQCGKAGTTTTLASPADASALSSCQTYSGSIAIASSASQPFEFSGIQKIDEDFVANNATQVTSITFDSLREIGGKFSLTSMITLSTLSATRLNKVGSIMWQALPALSALDFGNPGIEKCDSVDIENTQLANFDGINLVTVGSFSAENNPYCTTVNFPQLANTTGAVTITSNNPNNCSILLPKLIYANNLTINSASAIDLSSLQSVNTSLGFNHNSLSTIDLSNLTSVGSSLYFNANGQLTQVNAPQLKTVGGALSFTNNTNYKNITFPDVQVVGGALTVEGSLNNLNLPMLKDVKGAFTISSDQDITAVCNKYNNLGGGIIKGTVTCKSKTKQDNSGSGTGTDGSSSGSSTKSSAASPDFKPVAMSSFAVVISALFGLL